jgi:O-acetylserine/cysteine efflux transporter
MKQRYVIKSKNMFLCCMIAWLRVIPVTTRDRLLALLVVTVWGLNFVVIDWGLAGIPGGVPPLLFVALRFCLVSLAAFVVPRPAARWRDLALVGAFMSVGQFGLMYSSLAAGLPPGLASLVLQIQAAFTVVLGVIVLGEHPRRAQLVGVALGLAGLGIVALGRGGAVPLVALGLCVAAAGCWAAGNIASRRLQGVGGLALTVWSGLVVPIPLLALSLLLDGPTRVGGAALALLGSGALPAWLSSLYTAALGSLLGYGVWNSLLGRHRVAEVAPYSLLVPVVGMSAAYLIRGERPGLLALAGGVVLVTGVAVTVLPGRAPQPQGGSERESGSGSGPPAAQTATPHSRI